MIYLSAKKDLEYIQKFYEKAKEYIELKENVEVYNQYEMNPTPINNTDNEDDYKTYMSLREEINKMRSHAISISQRYNANMVYISDYPPITGLTNPVSVHPFDAIINDRGYEKITNLEINDLIQYLIGNIEGKLIDDKRKIINPLYWLKSLITFILQLPFIVLELAGFNREKIEEHLISKYIKLLYFLAIIYIGIKFGVDLTIYKGLIK